MTVIKIIIHYTTGDTPVPEEPEEGPLRKDPPPPLPPPGRWNKDGGRGRYANGSTPSPRQWVPPPWTGYAAGGTPHVVTQDFLDCTDHTVILSANITLHISGRVLGIPHCRFIFSNPENITSSKNHISGTHAHGRG